MISVGGFITPRYTGYSVKMEGKQGHTPLTLWIQRVSGKIVLASLCTLEHFLDYFTLNKILFHDVSAILNIHLNWTPSLPPILNELRIANFPELLMSSLRYSILDSILRSYSIIGRP